MITRITNWLLVGLLVLVLWHADTQAQQGVWERYMRAGVAAHQQGNYGEAVKQTKAALEAAEAFGPDDPRLATTFNNLALVYQALGKYTEAEPLFKRSLAISEKTLGPEHPSVANVLERYAVLLRKTGRTAEADNLDARAKAIWSKRAAQGR